MSEARGGEPVYALTDAEMEVLRFCNKGGRRGRNKPERSAARRALIVAVRKRTGWGLRDSFLLVRAVGYHNRPVTYDEIRVERLHRITSDSIQGTAARLNVTFKKWREGFTTGEEAEQLEDAAYDLQADVEVLLAAARELRFERGEDDPAAEQADRRAQQLTPIPEDDVERTAREAGLA